MSSLQTIAQRYALALFELGVESNTLEKLTADVKSLGDTVTQNPALADVLVNPTVAPASRKAIMREIGQKLGVSPLVGNAMLLITDHGRASLFPRIAAQLVALADEKAGRVRAEVISAEALTDVQYTRITAALEKVTGRKIALEKKVDAGLIGGVVTRVGDTVYDGSVKNRLSEIRQALLPS